MVFVDVDKCFGTAAEVCARLKTEGVLALPTLPQRVRMVCHLDVTRPMIERAVQTWKTVIQGRPAETPARRNGGRDGAAPVREPAGRRVGASKAAR
jgi:hypothetical protein